MKKVLSLLFLSLYLSIGSVVAQDKFCNSYLKGKSHFSPGKSIVENVVASSIKGVLKKETGAKFDVKFKGYTLSSIKKGIFKSLEITGRNVATEGVLIPYVHLVSLTDYNYIDYKSNPVKFKSDMQFAYDIELDDNAINTALSMDEYQKITNKVNKIAYPLFMIKAIKTKIINNRLYIVISYNFPISKTSKDRSFVTSTDFKVLNGKIIASDVKLDSAYGNISLDKVANLINLLNPLEFTINMLDSKQCNANIENVNIVDNTVKVNGKIYVKGE